MKKEANPSVLAFEKKIVPSDGFMYAANWAVRDTEYVPLYLTEKAIRGTFSNVLKNQTDKELDKKMKDPNLQVIDQAALPVGMNTLKVVFTVKFLPGMNIPNACNDYEFGENVRKAGENYMEKYGCKELAHRYATNLAAGKFLWRNRIGAECIGIKVAEENRDSEWVFDGHDFSLRSFKTTSKSLKALENKIADAFCGKIPYLQLTVTANVLVGNGQEVYPSQELVMNKERFSKSKVLYSVNGQAAMHSQKIGNAIRQIDTWYPDYNKMKEGPIAVEAYGAVTSIGRAFRPVQDGKDFYTLFADWARGRKLPEEDQHYVVAMLIRGGVFSEAQDK